MLRAVNEYLTTLCDSFGDAWNRFWYTAVDPLPLAVLRILVGLIAILFHLSYWSDLSRWFAADGILPINLTTELLGDDVGYHPSYLFLFDDPTSLSVAHGVGLIVLVLFTLGLFSRITSVLALMVVLSTVHRAPILVGQLEPVLTMMLAYLAIGPCGARLSLDAKALGAKRNKNSPERSILANVSIRLIQVHLCGFYLMMGFSKLYGEVWWTGEAVWWILARTETRLVDLTFLHNAPLLINAWTHAIVAFELVFAVLIWNRLARPLLIAISLVMWPLLALVTGLVSFCAIMMVANLAFVSPEIVQAMIPQRRSDTAS